MRVAVLEDIETYICRHQNTEAQYIATNPIMDLCLYMDRSLVSRTLMRWW